MVLKFRRLLIKYQTFLLNPLCSMSHAAHVLQESYYFSLQQAVPFIIKLIRLNGASIVHLRIESMALPLHSY